MRLVKTVQFLVLAAAAFMPLEIEAREAAQAKLSAEANAYMNYRKEVPKAKRLEDLYFYFDAKSVEYYRSLSAPERTKIIEQLKAQVTLFPEFTVAKEERGAGSTTVLFNAKSADGKQAAVAVEIFREGAALKVGQATWKAAQ